MRNCFNNTSAWNLVAGILILLVFSLYVGCGITNPPKSKTLEIKAVEEVMKEYYKKLHTVEELTLETEVTSQIVIAKGTQEYFIEYIKANLKILPFSDSRQKISNLEIIPTGKTIENAL